MNKRLILTFIAVAVVSITFAQQVSRHVVASGGNYSSNSGYTISSTIGESMVTTLTSASNVLTQGFQQSFNNPVDPTITIINPLNGDVFPNNNNIGIDFAITDFVVAAGTGDGHIHYFLNGAMTMKYDTLPIVLNGLADGNYEMIIALTDNSHNLLSPTVADTVNFIVQTAINGCTDPSAGNYDANATVDDGSCTSPSCNEDSPTGLYVDGIVHTRAVINWDNMNSSTCTVDQYRIRYKEVGTSSWSQKTMGGPVGSCTWGNQKTDKLLLNLTASTTYEYEMKAWYCGGGSSAWTGLSTFTTLDNCPNVGNLAAVGANPTKATFTWDASNGVYAFVRLKARVDSISNPSGSDFFQIGGAGVSYGTYTKDKNGLTPGETYRGQARSYCDPNGGAWKSVTWSPLVYWTQPVVRVEGGTAIANLDVYPNPSRDLFNVTFTSEDVQDLEVRVINVVGEVVYTENLQQFVGEYTKSIDLETYTKGVYFLEITTNNGVVNKKLILQ